MFSSQRFTESEQEFLDTVKQQAFESELTASQVRVLESAKARYVDAVMACRRSVTENINKNGYGGQIPESLLKDHVAVSEAAKTYNMLASNIRDVPTIASYATSADIDPERHYNPKRDYR